MNGGKETHILNASSNLLGICFILIAGMKLTNTGENTLADEISIASSLCFLASCILSYLSIRTEKSTGPFEKGADYLFILGIFSLFIAVLFFATGIL
ncbi:MAG: hypothetical protein PHY92_04055 [Alphaproteobacteria bacterium]|nr:hypothetical protein [Alphaproteobacteria bacterium]